MSPESTIASATSESPHSAEASSSCPDKSLQKTSPLSTLLVYPKQKTKTQQAPKCARVLTSAESLAYLEEKQRKKKEEQEQKEQRKKEREMKKLQKEQEKIRKQQEKEAKKNQQKTRTQKLLKGNVWLKKVNQIQLRKLLKGDDQMIERATCKSLMKMAFGITKYHKMRVQLALGPMKKILMMMAPLL